MTAVKIVCSNCAADDLGCTACGAHGTLLTTPPAAEGAAEPVVDVAAHRSSYPMGNGSHGTAERPDWGTFCVECTQSWPCDVSVLADRLAAAEREAAEANEHAIECERIGVEAIEARLMVEAERDDLRREAAEKGERLAKVEALRDAPYGHADFGILRDGSRYIDAALLHRALSPADPTTDESEQP